MLRKLCVLDHSWMTSEEFEHAVATTGLLPGPASTQLAIYCAWRLRGAIGALIGALCFIVPGLVLILVLSAAFFAAHPSHFLVGAALGAGAVVPAIAFATAWSMLRPSYDLVVSRQGRRVRWAFYLAIGVATSIAAAQLVVVALVACGLGEIVSRRSSNSSMGLVALGSAKVAALGGLGALAWVALKVGALSYGGGFVIIPLMQHDVVSVYHWMSGVQFLNVVALGQLTPGPVVLTVAAVGYAAHGLVGGLIATVVAFGPSLLFIIGGARHFEALRQNETAQAFLAGAAPCVIGAIGGAAIPLGLLLVHLWQLPILILGVLWLLWKKGASVYPLLAAAVVGALLSPLLPL